MYPNKAFFLKMNDGFEDIALSKELKISFYININPFRIHTQTRAKDTLLFLM